MAKLPEPTADQVLSLLVKRQPKNEYHVNVRMTGEEAFVFEQLRHLSRTMPDSERIRDAVRVAAFILLLKKKGTPVKAVIDGKEVDLLDYLGVYSDAP